MTVLRSGSATHVGRVRSVNEDRSLEGDMLFAVADGMGGHAGGEVAASIAVDSLESAFAQEPSPDGLVEAVHEANEAVLERGLSDPSLRGMGTTLVAAALVSTEDGDRLAVANVGDSRAYRLHGGVLEQLSVDHSVAEALVAQGELSEDEAAVHPKRHILTRALGIDPDIDVDMWELAPVQGDRYLLCSDGLSNELSSHQIKEVLGGSRDPKKAAESLVRTANASGGNDNITAVVLDVVVGEPPADEGEGDRIGTVDEVQEGAVAREGRVLATAGGVGPDGAPSWTWTAVIGRAEEAAKGAPAAAATRKSPPPKRRVPRRITVRVLLFALLLGGLGYGAWAAVRWYVDSSYFVALSHGHVTVFQGRRGGFLGMDPKVLETSAMTESQLPSYIASSLRSGVEEASKSAADSYVKNVNEQLCAEQPVPSGVQCPPPTTSPAKATVPPPVSTSTAVRAPTSANGMRFRHTLAEASRAFPNTCAGALVDGTWKEAA